VNCCEAPLQILGFNGVTAMDVSVAGARTVSVVLLLTTPSIAEMVVAPVETPVAKPLATIVATPVFDEVHVT
jgi:hypothetical protein